MGKGDKPGGGYLWKVDGRDYSILPDTNNITAIYDPFDWVPTHGNNGDQMEEDEQTTAATMATP